MRIGLPIIVLAVALFPHFAAAQSLPEAGRRALLSKYPFVFDQMFTTSLGVVSLELTEVNWRGGWVLLGPDDKEFDIKSFMGGWSYLTRLLLHQGYLERGETGPQSGDQRKTPLRLTAKFQNLAPWRASRMDGPGYLGLGLIVSRLDSIDKVEVQKSNSQELWRVLYTYSTRFVIPEVPNLFPGIRGYAVLGHDTFTEQWGVVQSGPMARGYDDDSMIRGYWTWLRDNPSKWQTDAGKQIEASFLHAAGSPTPGPRQSAQGPGVGSKTQDGSQAMSVPSTTGGSMPPPAGSNGPPLASVPATVLSKPTMADVTRTIPNAEYFRESQKSFGREFDAVWNAARRVLGRSELGSSSGDRIQTDDQERGIMITEPTVHRVLLLGGIRRQYVVLFDRTSPESTRVTVKGFCYTQRGQQWITVLPQDRCSSRFIQDLDAELAKGR